MRTHFFHYMSPLLGFILVGVLGLANRLLTGVNGPRWLHTQYINQPFLYGPEFPALPLYFLRLCPGDVHDRHACVEVRAPVPLLMRDGG